MPVTCKDLFFSVHPIANLSGHWYVTVFFLSKINLMRASKGPHEPLAKG